MEKEKSVFIQPLPVLKCTNCGYKWYPRKNRKPRQCPKCKVLEWDKPRASYRPRLTKRLNQNQTWKEE